MDRFGFLMEPDGLKNEGALEHLIGIDLFRRQWQFDLTIKCHEAVAVGTLERVPDGLESCLADPHSHRPEARASRQDGTFGHAFA